MQTARRMACALWRCLEECHCPPKKACSPATSHILIVTFPFRTVRRLKATVGAMSSVHCTRVSRPGNDKRNITIAKAGGRLADERISNSLRRLPGPTQAHERRSTFPMPDKRFALSKASDHPTIRGWLTCNPTTVISAFLAKNRDASHR